MNNQNKGNDNENPMNTLVDGTPFSVLLDQAVKIKKAQCASLRTKFDSYPKFYQNSIFPLEEVIQARDDTISFDERLNAAKNIKNQGNIAFQQSHFPEAISQYEKTLSVFKYLENHNPNWKTEVSIRIIA